METDTKVNNIFTTIPQTCLTSPQLLYTNYSYITNKNESNIHINIGQPNLSWFTIASASETGLAGFISC